MTSLISHGLIADSGRWTDALISYTVQTAFVSIMQHYPLLTDCSTTVASPGEYK